MEQPMKILVIDDDRPVREVVGLALEDAGYDITTAESGEKGLKLAKDIEFDLVLSDIKMPGMNGVEVAKSLIASNYDGGIILMTAYPGEYSEDSVLSVGINAYLKKPFKIDELLRVTESVLSSKRRGA